MDGECLGVLGPSSYICDLPERGLSRALQRLRFEHRTGSRRWSSLLAEVSDRYYGWGVLLLEVARVYRVGLAQLVEMDMREVSGDSVVGKKRGVKAAVKVVVRNRQAGKGGMGVEVKSEIMAWEVGRPQIVQYCC